MDGLKIEVPEQPSPTLHTPTGQEDAVTDENLDFLYDTRPSFTNAVL